MGKSSRPRGWPKLLMSASLWEDRLQRINAVFSMDHTFNPAGIAHQTPDFSLGLIDRRWSEFLGVVPGQLLQDMDNVLAGSSPLPEQIFKTGGIGLRHRQIQHGFGTQSSTET